MIWRWFYWFSKNSRSHPFFGSTRYIQSKKWVRPRIFRKSTKSSTNDFSHRKTIFIQFWGHLVNNLSYFYCFDSQRHRDWELSGDAFFVFFWTNNCLWNIFPIKNWSLLLSNSIKAFFFSFGELKKQSKKTSETKKKSLLRLNCEPTHKHTQTQTQTQALLHARSEMKWNEMNELREREREKSTYRKSTTKKMIMNQFHSILFL